MNLKNNKQICAHDKSLTGNVIKWEQQVRIRHLTTRRYLMIDQNKVTVTANHDDPNTVFRLHPVIKVSLSACELSQSTYALLHFFRVYMYVF